MEGLWCTRVGDWGRSEFIDGCLETRHFATELHLSIFAFAGKILCIFGVTCLVWDWKFGFLSCTGDCSRGLAPPA
jgi:hypothetical protein